MILDEFVSFLDKCPTQFHFCKYARSELLKSGFTELSEEQEWKDIPNKCFFIRDEREIVAWHDSGHTRAIIAGAHCDFPCLILKPNFDEAIGGYRRCRCNTYGTSLWYSWFDRNLRLAGRVLIKTLEDEKELIRPMLFDSEIGIATIPCIAPHLGSFGPQSMINPDINLIPIYGIESQTPPLLDYISSKLNIETKDIVSYDLHFIDSDPPLQIFKENDSIIHSQRLNGLQNSYTVLKSFINSTPDEGTISMITIFDNEVTGNKTMASAGSNIIDSTLQRILNFDISDFRCFKANSFFVNCKSFHAQNPNFAGNGIFRNVRLGNGICMQRSSAIKSVSSPKNDFPIFEVIKNILIESTIEKDDDHALNDSAAPFPMNRRRMGNRFRNPNNNAKMEPQITYRSVTIKEAADDDDFNDDKNDFVAIPIYNNLDQFDDKDYPFITKKFIQSTIRIKNKKMKIQICLVIKKTIISMKIAMKIQKTQKS